jgi:hypothetical protein
LLLHRRDPACAIATLIFSPIPYSCTNLMPSHSLHQGSFSSSGVTSFLVPSPLQPLLLHRSVPLPHMELTELPMAGPVVEIKTNFLRGTKDERF